MFFRDRVPAALLSLLLAGSTMLCTDLADAAAPSSMQPSASAWQDFTLDTWKRWTASPSRRVAVVFTTTDCEYCPAVIAQVREAIDRLPAPRPALRVVITDGDNFTSDIGAQRWYALADERFTFHGQDMPLRHAVNPRWRGETPYVALLAPPAAPRFVAGRPSPADLAVLGAGATDD